MAVRELRELQAQDPRNKKRRKHSDGPGGDKDVGEDGEGESFPNSSNKKFKKARRPHR